MIKSFTYRIVLAGVLFMAAQTAALATVITYSAVDLADTTPGDDLWQYRYDVSGSFVQFGGFEVFFDPTLYKSIQTPAPAVNGDWSVIIIQPNLALPVDGIYDASANVNNPSLADPFVIDFVWLGAGTPGSQPFDVFDDSFAPPIDVGTTSAPVTPAVPLPNTLMLCALGLVLLARAARRGAYAPR